MATGSRESRIQNPEWQIPSVSVSVCAQRVKAPTTFGRLPHSAQSHVSQYCPGVLYSVQPVHRKSEVVAEFTGALNA